MPTKAKSDPVLLGAAAEHHVMCQLLRRQMIAALAPTGVPDADIIVSNHLGSALAAVQVKARREIGSDGGWSMRAKHEGMRRDLLFYCFVDFGRELIEQPKCWVVPSAVIAEALTVAHRAWLKMPGIRGQQHNDNELRRLRPDYTSLGLEKYKKGWMDAYRDAWHLIAKESEHPQKT